MPACTKSVAFKLPISPSYQRLSAVMASSITGTHARCAPIAGRLKHRYSAPPQAWSSQPKKNGFSMARLLKWGQTTALGGLAIEAVQAQYAIGLKVNNYVLQAGKARIFFGSETRDIKPLVAYRKTAKPVDLALLPIDGATVLGQRLVALPHEAINAARILGAPTMVPVHYALKSVPPLLIARAGLHDLVIAAEQAPDINVQILPSRRPPSIFKNTRPRSSMMARTRPLKHKTHYSKIQIVLHWSIALLVFIQFFIGDFAQLAAAKGLTDLARFTHWLPMVKAHMIIGITILILASLRLVVRLRQNVPRPDRYQGRAFTSLARHVHRWFYILLFALPILGVAATKWLDQHFGTAHSLASWVLATLILLHITAALIGQFILRDKILSRIISFSQKP